MPIQTSLVGTPSLTAMTDGGQASVQVDAEPTADDLHCHEGPVSPSAEPTGEGSSGFESAFAAASDVPTPAVVSRLKIMEFLAVHWFTRFSFFLKGEEKRPAPSISGSSTTNSAAAAWRPTSRWVSNWHAKLPLQTIMRLLQVLVPQVEKICIDKYVVR